MPLDAPFRLGPFVVDRQGRIAPDDPACFPIFHLAWRGYAVHAHMEAGGAGGAGGRLVFSTVVGRVPSTAGGDFALNGARRARMFDAVRALESAAEPNWNFGLLADHSVTVNARRDLDLPASMVDLVTQVTCFLLELASYLDVLDEIDRPAGVSDPAWSGGITNTWPG